MKTLVIIIGAIFASFITSGSASHAQGNEIHGCYKKNEGGLRIVSHPGACRPSEVPVSWKQAGRQGPQGEVGPAGPQGPAGPAGSVKVEQGPRVYDARGQFLGILPGDLEGFLSVFIPGLSKFISFSSSTGDVDPFFPAAYVYFDGENCTGSSYVDTSLRYQVFRLDAKYAVSKDAPSECIDIRSVSSPDWGAGRQCRSRSSACMPVLPYEEVRLPFSVPVAFPLSFEYGRP